MQFYRYFMSQFSEFCRHSLCVTSRQVFIVVVVVHFIIDSIRKILGIPSFIMAAGYLNLGELKNYY
jgi:hypothetical protein